MTRAAFAFFNGWVVLRARRPTLSVASTPLLPCTIKQNKTSDGRVSATRTKKLHPIPESFCPCHQTRNLHRLPLQKRHNHTGVLLPLLRAVLALTLRRTQRATSACVCVSLPIPCRELVTIIRKYVKTSSHKILKPSSCH